MVGAGDVEAVAGRLGDALGGLMARLGDAVAVEVLADAVVVELDGDLGGLALTPST